MQHLLLNIFVASTQKQDYALRMDIYETFDFLVDTFFLSLDLREELGHIDWVYKYLGDEPTDEAEFDDFRQKVREERARLLKVHKPFLDKLIHDSFASWPKQKARQRIEKLDDEQRTFLSIRIDLARAKLKEYPNKTFPQLYEKEKDSFYPAICYMLLSS